MAGTSAPGSPGAGGRARRDSRPRLRTATSLSLGAPLSRWQISWLSYGPGRHPAPPPHPLAQRCELAPRTQQGLQQTSAQNRARGLHQEGNDLGGSGRGGSSSRLLPSHLIPASSFPRSRKGRRQEEGMTSKSNSSWHHRENHVAPGPPWLPQDDFPHSSYMFSLENKHPPDVLYFMINADLTLNV